MTTSRIRGAREGASRATTALLVLATITAGGQETFVDLGRADDEPERTAIILPYAFYTESLAWAAGLAGGTNGHVQPQMQLFGAVMGSTNGSYGVYGAGAAIQAPLWSRLFIDPRFALARYTENRLYTYDGSAGGAVDAGTNDSDADAFLRSAGHDTWAEVDFRHLLPTGHGRNAPIHVYEIRDGLLAQPDETVSGGTAWSPLDSGRLYLSLQPFYRRMTFEANDEVASQDFSTNGIRVAVEYDNRDFVPSPSRGFFARLRSSLDFGALDSSSSWSVIEGDYRHYFPLPTPEALRQQVIAIRFWTAETTSWNERRAEGGTRITHRPPPFEGATLGGFYRLRGFPQQRFNDRAAIYYGAEYRVIPRWNPLAGLESLGADWIQLAAFVEAGRVADSWDIVELHSRLKWDAGLGVRAMVQNGVVRFDVAISDETWGAWLMVGQTF